MKRKITALFCALAMLCACAPAALANSWNLKGELYAAVSVAHTWDDYTALRQAGNAAVMNSRYHNALMLIDPADGALRVYTRAVYQPEKKRDKQLTLTAQQNGFTLSYGQEESYAFFLHNGAYHLREAVIGFSFRMTAEQQPGGGYDDWLTYLASDGSTEARYRFGMPLADFNITLFPRTVQAVRDINLLLAALDSGSQCLSREGMRFENAGKGTEEVFSAPDASAWRAAKGKAAVGLGGELWLLGGYKNADGEAYACIKYDVSARTQRVGYIRAAALHMSADAFNADNAGFIRVPVTAARDTYLTDDPEVSQFAQFSVPQGTQLACLGLYGSAYAYVAARVDKNNALADAGQAMWGFVPLSALALCPDAAAQTQPDVMAALSGVWAYSAGGSMAEDFLALNADGTYFADSAAQAGNIAPAALRGTWYVTRYDPAQGLYWNDPPYEITFLRADGTVNRKGLVLDAEGFSLTDWEGGGGYARRSEPIPEGYGLNDGTNG